MLAQGWFGLDDVFWLMVLVIFLATIFAALVSRLRKDKCLTRLHDHLVTWLGGQGEPIWGDLWVSGQGMELRYDAPYVNARGLAKSSCLVFPDEWPKGVGLTRSVHGLTDRERRARDAQVRASFSPGLVRRMVRGVRNLLNTIRDAITKTLSLFVGALASRGQVGQAVGKRKGEVDELGSTLVGVVANAYEPLLERHIGRPVILQLQGPAGKWWEFPGYLVDYTEKFLAVFNVEHAPEEVLELDTAESATAPGMGVDLLEHKIVVTCTGPEAIVVRRLEQADRAVDLGVALLPNCRLALKRVPGQPVKVLAERTRRLDVVCPRARARIRFGSEGRGPSREGWSGAAPESEV